MEKKNRYTTKQRIEIFNFIKNNENNLYSAINLKEHLDTLNLSIGLTTIYRFLNELEQERQVKSEYKYGIKYYKYIPQSCYSHPHLKCGKCGKLIHLEYDEFYKLKKHIKDEHNFNINDNVTILGICKECNK